MPGFGSNVLPVNFGGGLYRPAPWPCACPGNPLQPAYRANCPDCWTKRPAADAFTAPQDDNAQGNQNQQ